MTALAEQPRLRAVGRLALLVAAIALTTWGVCLIAFSDTVRGTRLGIPIAFWGVLLGYTAIRVNGDRAASFDPEVVTAASIALPPHVSAELVRERDQAMRHEYELRLEVMLRRELERVLRTELSGLRRDVAELRGDVLDAVDGRLQLERVEITRIIGSNLAALQDDGRISVHAGAADVALVMPRADLEQRSVRADGSSARTAIEVNGGASHDDDAADILRAVQDVGVISERGSWVPATSSGARPAGPALPATMARSSAAEAARPSEPEPQAWPPRSEAVAGPGFRPHSSSPVPSRPAGSLPLPSPEPVPLTAPVPNPSPDVEAAPLTESSSIPPRSGPPDPHVDPEPTPPRSSDPFASLPRLSAFRLPDLPAGLSLDQPEPVEAEPAVTEVSSPAPAAGPAGNGYVGRRRHAFAGEGEAEPAADRGEDAADEPGDEPSGSPSGRHGAAPGTVSSAGRPAGSGVSARPVAHRR